MILSFLASSFFIITIEQSSVSEAKKEILKAVYKESDSNKDLAVTLISIASIETHNMSIDYPKCDNKIADACNVGIYKMNLFQQRKVCSDKTSAEINESIATATKCMIKGINKYGLDLWLSWHRGGEGWKNYSKDVIEYKNAIQQIKTEYMKNEDSLSNDIRYTVDLDAI